MAFAPSIIIKKFESLSSLSPLQFQRWRMEHGLPFGKGELTVEPSLGRALIQDALLRFLLKADYKLEPGGDYIFTVRSKF